MYTSGKIAPTLQLKPCRFKSATHQLIYDVINMQVTGSTDGSYHSSLV